MPANLNALIRYKQIDECLRNRYLMADIRVLQEKCSERLGEHRGTYKLVSERTIRDDIRVMRSGALGFDAPIVVKNGIYSYEDPEYSIFNRPLEEQKLLKTIFILLMNEREKIKNPMLEDVLEELSSITGMMIKEEKVDVLEESALPTDNTLKKEVAKEIQGDKKPEKHPKDKQKGYIKLHGVNSMGGRINLDRLSKELKTFEYTNIPKSTAFLWSEILKLL